jgi:hypothetical protein
MDGADLNARVLEPVEFIHQENVTSAMRIANIRANAGRDRDSVTFKRICICASGPSLTDHVEDIRARQKAGWDVAAMNGSHNFLIERGITPDFMFMVDARPGMNLPFLAHRPKTTIYVIASQCDPEIFEALEAHRVLLWQMFHDHDGLAAIEETMGGKGRNTPKFVGHYNVGQSCLNPIWAMGYRTWHLFGYDGSMRGDDKHAFAQPQNDAEAVQEFFWPMGEDGNEVPGVTKRYLATPTMAHGAQEMPNRISYFRRAGVEIELFGEGLIPDMVRALSSTEGAMTAPKLEKPVTPAPRPRKRDTRSVASLPIVTFKWKGHIPYHADDVQIWANQVHRHMHGEHECLVITDDFDGLDDVSGIIRYPMWRDHFEHGRDWHRLKLFAEEMADTIGPRFVVMDLDTLICGQLDPLFAGDAPFKAWRDPNRDQYCTALFMMDAGAYPHVWETFDPVAALRLRTQGLFGGYDQAWISHVLPGQERWTREDGVLSFRNDILNGGGLPQDEKSPYRWAPPASARIINFHGKHNPRDPEVQAAFPWIANFYQ